MTLLENTLERLIGEFDFIAPERKRLLASLAEGIRKWMAEGKPIRLNFICTHNSRRSHLSQLWAQKAAAHYHVPDVECLSGGTEATAFHPNAVKAMQGLGFEINKVKDGANPVYEVKLDKQLPAIQSFSKRYDDPFNQRGEFIAVMTCSHADEGCPIVSGASERYAVTYDDPKAFDGTTLQDAKYLERALQIGREMLYTFSLINTAG